MPKLRGMNLSAERKELDQLTRSPDTKTDPMELAIIAVDAIKEGMDHHEGGKVIPGNKTRYAEGTRILADIPPVVLGKTTYRVVSGSRHGLELAGPRGGWTSLVRSQKDPSQWAHNSGNKTVWYRRNPDFTFTRL